MKTLSRKKINFMNFDISITDELMDGPTNGQKNPLIEMQGHI